MALQSRDLVMVGLGVLNDAPPNALQPKLADGIHLRWAFSRDRGFPWRGFYLYRRTHVNGDRQPICIAPELRTQAAGPLPGASLNLSFVQITSDTRLVLTENWPQAGDREIDLEGRAYVRAVFTQARARRVVVRIGFRAAATITVTALWDGIPMDERRVQGRAGQNVVETIEADSITELLVTGGPAALIDLCYVRFSDGANLNWQPVPNLVGRVCLPVTEPDYPCSPAPEHVGNSRAAARRRIRYGDPDRLAATPAGALAPGSVAVVDGSPLVTGTLTKWTPKHVGLVLQLKAENTAYVVAAVLAPDRLVLNRPYHGVSGAGRSYTLQRDNFGQLHDYLAVLVSGGPLAGPMTTRMLPGPLTEPGTVSTMRNSTVVTGRGTNWTASLVGLRFRVVGASTGTIALQPGDDIVTGTGTAWTAALVGMELEIDGDRRAYAIAHVDGPNRLRLARPYLGTIPVSARYRIVERPLYRVATVDSATRLTLDVPYAGRTAGGSAYEIAVVLHAPGAANRAPRLPRFRPLDIVLMGALDPAIAQMLGLYWVDATADPAVTYDYLVIADDTGIGNDAASVLQSWIASGYANADGFIAYNLRLAPAPALAVPAGVRAYALPGVTATTAAGDVVGSAGLVWTLPANDDGVVLTRSAIMYHVWRADFGANEPAAPAAADRFALRTTNGPIIAANLLPSLPLPPRPSDWPPVRLFFTDDNLREGWYSFNVNGVDVFGRHSRSATVEWWQWAPMPDPRPWYYQDPPGDSRVRPFAIGLLDKAPPPAPALVTAFALDPFDPTVVRDLTFTTWWTALRNAAWYQALNEEQRANLIGLRIRWHWTASQQAQAPDTREFRIYYQPDRFNILSGQISGTADANAQVTIVTTDVPNLAAADAYLGARLHCGNDNWEIVGSDAASPLRVRVRNIGPNDDIGPPQQGACAIVIPDRDPRHPRFVDPSRALAWQERFHVVPYDQQWTAAPAGDGRIYDVFLPDPNGPVRAGAPLVTSLANPRVFAQIGVSAADNRRHTADNPRWSDPARWAGGIWGGADRYGNEGAVGGPPEVFRIRRGPPPTPVPPLDDESVFATAADYHSRSYYTVRWTRVDDVKTHIYRALDEALFSVDWELRATPSPLDPDNRDHDRFFPSTPRWRTAVADDDGDRRRRQVARDLNALDGLRAASDRARAMAAYRALSNDALRVLAGLPGRERAFSQLTIQALDPDDASTSDRRGPDDPSNYAPLPNLRSWLDTLDGRATNRYLYRAANVDGVQNRSPLSLAWPPLRLHDVTAPRAPIVTKVLGGDRQVIVRWMINREPDLDSYLLFRAESAHLLRDVRLVAPRVVAADAAAREQQELIDGPLAGTRDYFYRLAARDQSGNVSPPSAIFQARVVDAEPPAPPGGLTATASSRRRPDGMTEPGVLLTWDAPAVTVDTQVHRKAFGEVVWRALHTVWLVPGTTQYFDATASAGTRYQYRLRVRKPSGAINVRYDVADVSL